MAEGLLKAIVNRREAADPAGAGDPNQWRIESAGIWALPGQPAAVFTRQVLAERGISLPDFLSQRMDRQMLGEFNLVLTMERGQKEALRAAFPELAPKIVLISELVGKNNDIVDPIGGQIHDYEDTAQELEHILTQGYDRLRRMAADASTLRTGQSFTNTGG